MKWPKTPMLLSADARDCAIAPRNQWAKGLCVVCVRSGQPGVHRRYAVRHWVSRRHFGSWPVTLGIIPPLRGGPSQPKLQGCWNAAGRLPFVCDAGVRHASTHLRTRKGFARSEMSVLRRNATQDKPGVSATELCFLSETSTPKTEEGEHCPAKSGGPVVLGQRIGRSNQLAV